MCAEVQTKVQASPAQNFTPAQTDLLQRKCALCNTPGLVEDSGQDKEKLTLQRSSTDQAGTTTMRRLRSPEQSLNSDTRTYMEPGFRHDFSKVRVHRTGLGMIQNKLKINKLGDLYEQEADRVAERVMRMEELRVQRRPDEELIQKKPVITPLVQRQSERAEEEIPGRSNEVASALSPQSVRGGGQPLPESTRAYFEPRFGHDFSRVRIHADERAAKTAQSINARAFTVGKDVSFGSGQYSPDTTEGKKLLAHELTHMVQQTGNDNLKRNTIDSKTHIAPVRQTLTAPQIQGKWNYTRGMGRSGGEEGDTTSGNASTSQTGICALRSDLHNSCAIARAHTWQKWGVLKSSYGGRAKAFRWVTSDYTFKNDHKDAHFLTLRGKGTITGSAKAEDLEHARAGALILGRITENPHANRTSKKLFHPLSEGGISAASVGDLGEIDANVPIGGASVNLKFKLTKVNQGMQAPINDHNSLSYNVPNSVDEVDISITVRAEADADVEDEFWGGYLASGDENTGMVLAKFRLDWESRPAPSSSTSDEGGIVGPLAPKEKEEKKEEILHRSPDNRESASRLARKAEEAEKDPRLHLHGVSAFSKPMAWPHSKAPRADVEKHFPVHNTLGPTHRTIVLPKPVTRLIVDRFNRIFGRK